MRPYFDNELKKLNETMLQMGKLVEESIENSIQSLINKDSGLASKTIENDEKIDILYIDIEKECFRLIAMQQPAARDLRKIGSILKVVTDLERMADHAVSIAKVTIRLENEKLVKELIDISKMANLIKEMVSEALISFVELDKSACIELAKKDEDVDVLHKKLYQEMVLMMETNPKTVLQGTQLLFVAYHLERIGDHVTNLSEWILYQITGNLINLNE